MNKINVLGLLLFFINNLYAHPHAITNGIEQWRRLGDNITTISKTVYFSHKFNLPIFYTPFTYSDSFALSTQETILSDEIKKKFSKIIVVGSEKDIEANLDDEEPILFVCVFLSPTPWMYAYSRENAIFEQTIKKLFTPLQTIAPLQKDSKNVLVALHVRKGAGYDWPLASTQEYTLQMPLINKKELYLIKKNPGISCDDIWPLRCLPGPAYTTETKNLFFKKNFYADYIWAIKFPPDQYYIEQIKTLALLLPGKNFKIQLFTDDADPEAIVNRYTKALTMLPNQISFYYRKTGNNHDKNVIEDLFAIAQHDCLICASSSFGFAAMLLGNHSIIIFPEHAITMPDKVIIDKIKVVKVENSTDYAKRTVVYDILGINNII